MLWAALQCHASGHQVQGLLRRAGGLALQQADCKQIRMGRWQTRKCQDVPRESGLDLGMTFIGISWR